MQAPTLPPDEFQRLQALRELKLLDTPAEERFDRLTRLARQALEVPVALISLVDADRQWFKSRQGLEVCETGREISFCGHSILGKEIFEVSDARLDPRFADNPLVTGSPQIRLYAGAPIASANGHLLGTLCVISDQPRQLTERERNILRDLADCVEAEINQVELKRQGSELSLTRQLSEIITRAQSEFIRQNETDRRKAFDHLLADILALTESEYGFIGEVLHDAEGQPYLKTFAITNIAWSDETRAFYEANAPQGMEFTNLQSLFGEVLRSGQPLISNDPYHDPRRGGLPEGHPALNAFLGVPVHYVGEMVAMFGISNRPGGYDPALVDFLQPLMATLGQLISAARIQQQLKRSEARLRGLFELSPIGIALNDFETGAFIDVNAALLRPAGYTREEFFGLSYWDLTPRDYEAQEKLQLENLERTGRYGPYEKEYLCKDGSRYPVLLNGMLVPDTTGRKLIWSMIEDISERKQAEIALAEQARHTRTIIDNMVDGIITINARGRIQSFNPAAERIFGYSVNEVLGDNVSLLMPAPHRERHDGYLRAYQSSGVARIIGIGREVEGLRKDGSLFPMELAVSEITRYGQPLYVGMVRDISERKRMERMKSEFVSTVSHELRTPLTSISGALGLISGGAMGEIPEQARQMVGIAYKNSQRLTHLINDLLDMEKIAAGKLHFEMQVLALMPLVEQALDNHQTYGAERRVALVLQGEAADVEVRVDSQRLMQVLANLLSNAIKFSPEGGVVEVAVSVCAEQARVAVIDRGPGIPASFRRRIFEKFSQADASDTRQKGGTGLGLAISRELVERMGGTIGFDSIEGSGTTFWVEFPLLRPGEPVLPEVDFGSPAMDAPRILVVEDEPDVAHVLCLMYARAGYQAERVATGAEALVALQKQSYAALSLDLMLPDISGLEVIRQVRQCADTADLPILVVSAKMEEGRIAIDGDFSAIDWLAKPIDESQLHSLVNGLVASSGTSKLRVLHVEDDDDLCQVVRSMAGDRFDFERAKSLRDARVLLAGVRVDIVILDIGLPDGSGWDLLPDIRSLQPNARVVILSGSDTSAEEAGRVESVLRKSKVSSRELLAALNSRIQATIQARKTP